MADLASNCVDQLGCLNLDLLAMSVTEYIEEIPFCYRVVSDYKQVYYKWHCLSYPDLFTGKAHDKETMFEQFKQVAKELKKLNRKKQPT